MKLSIITINYNNSAGLKKTIESVANQSVAPYQYIVVDGASNDGSVDVMNAFADLPFITLMSEPDSGIYNAMNKGIALAHGDYCLFLNSGDILYDDKVIERLNDFTLERDIEYGNQYVDVNGTLKKDHFLDPTWISFDTLRNSHIPHQTSLIRTAWIKQHGGYNENYRIISDWAFVMLSLFKWNGTIRHLETPIAIYDTTGISSDTDKSPQRAERNDFLQREFARFMPDYERWDKLKNSPWLKAAEAFRNIRSKLLRKK